MKNIIYSNHNDELDIVFELMRLHGYSHKLAGPLVHQTITKLEIGEITQQAKERIIEDILAFHPILVRVDQPNR